MLNVPAGVSKSTHNAGTFEPYDAARIIGDTSPGVAAAPQAKRNKCGAFGTILMIAVAVAIAVYAGPLVIGHAVSALGTTTAAAGSFGAIALGAIGGGIVGAGATLGSQIVGVGLGIQTGINWKGVALAGIGGAVGGALGGAGILSGIKEVGPAKLSASRRFGAAFRDAGRAALERFSVGLNH